MQRVLSSHSNDWPLHGREASRRIEQQALAKANAHALMQRAGAAVASLIRAVAPHARTAWIACGPGNNGGDGLEAAMQLAMHGIDVEVSLNADTSKMPADAIHALSRAQDAGIRMTQGTGPTASPDVAIDALLGLGSRRAPEGGVASRIAELNTLNCPVLAIDLPSGLNADTGATMGEFCVRATHTLSLLTLKPGLFTASGRDYAGSVWLDTLDIDNALLGDPDAWLSTRTPEQASRHHAHHKGSFGDVAVVGGATGMSGAALLAARAAHAAGAGRVYVDLLDASAMTVDPLRPELMFRPAWWQGDPTSLGASTVVCGCGGGNLVRTALPRLLSLSGRLVLDADALNAIATDEMLQNLLGTRQTKGLPTVLTPHPLEAARLLGLTAAEVQADRLHAAQAMAERWHCTVLLKGSGSVTATPGQVPCINPTGNASLATAGTGDVLAGWIAGVWSASKLDAHAVVRTASWLHGRAAETYSTGPLRAANLIEEMHRAGASH